MKNYYHLELVIPSKTCSPDEIRDFGTYTNLQRAISDANSYLRGYNRAIMGDSYLRIVTHDLYAIRQYGYRYDGKAYKWKLNRKVYYV